MKDTSSRLRRKLVETAIEMAGSEGVESVSLRRLAAAESVTTAAITYHFGNKSGLHQAAIRMSLEKERHFHDTLLNGNLQKLGYLGCSDYISNYIISRSKNCYSIFLLELLYRRSNSQGVREVLQEWCDVRYSFWRSILCRELANSNLSKLIVPYLIVEEVSAASMSEIPEYSLVLRETVRALLANGFGKYPKHEFDSPICEWLGKKAMEIGISSSFSPDKLSERLIDVASSEILRKGMRSINQRKIAKLANTSASMITYHFGGKAGFDNHAIWNAMVRDTPPKIIIKDSLEDKRESVYSWINRMSSSFISEINSKKAGFYLNYSKMSGEIALVSRYHSSLLPLAIKLRYLTGQNTYKAAKCIWLEDIQLSRSAASAYSSWSKGLAVMNDALNIGLTHHDLSRTFIEGLGAITGWKGTVKANALD